MLDQIPMDVTNHSRAPLTASVPARRWAPASCNQGGWSDVTQPHELEDLSHCEGGSLGVSFCSEIFARHDKMT